MHSLVISMYGGSVSVTGVTFVNRHWIGDDTMQALAAAAVPAVVPDGEQMN